MSVLTHESFEELRERVASAIGIAPAELVSREQRFLFKQKVAAYVLDRAGALTRGHIAELFGRLPWWVNCAVDEMDGRYKIRHIGIYVDKVTAAMWA